MLVPTLLEIGNRGRAVYRCFNLFVVAEETVGGVLWRAPVSPAVFGKKVKSMGLDKVRGNFIQAAWSSTGWTVAPDAPREIPKEHRA